MDVNELKSQLNNFESTSPCVNSGLGRVTMPLFVLHEKITTTINKMLIEKYQLSNSELDVLASLKYSGDEDYKLSPTRLYERLLFSSGGMTKVLKKLENKKYIRRVDNPNDGRSKLVQLTNNGSDLVDRSLEDVLVMEEEMFSHVNIKDRENLSKLLFKVLEKPE